MGLPGFAKILKYGCLAGFGLAAAFTAVAALSSPSSAQVNPNGGGDVSSKAWDTDNLVYTRGGKSYNAQSFNIPYHSYNGYSSSVEACKKNVADGFFQTDNSVVNDFPHLVASGTGANVRWGRAAGSANNNAGCDDFVAQQDRLAAQVAAGFAYSLDRNGNLVAAPSGSPYTTGRSASDLRYVIWTSKGFSYTGAKAYSSQTSNRLGATMDPTYLRRIDGGGRIAIFPSGLRWTEPQGTSGGNFGLVERRAWGAVKRQDCDRDGGVGSGCNLAASENGFAA